MGFGREFGSRRVCGSIPRRWLKCHLTMVLDSKTPVAGGSNSRGQSFGTAIDRLIARMEQVVPRFEDFGLSQDSLFSIKRAGFTEPSPIQAAFIPVALSGRDCIGQARTGTGKTAAFVLPILERIDLEDPHSGIGADANPRT